MENFKFVDGHFVHRNFLCDCGREHNVPIQEIIVKPGALYELIGVLDRLNVGKQGLVIADLNTYDAAGERVMEVFRKSAYTPELCLFNTRDIVQPDEYAVGKVLFDLEPETSFLLVIGSGCLTDITRVISARTGIPFIAMATAASMDGYASLGASMLKGGLKKTITSTCPQAIIADVDILCQAPYEMTVAGFGDLLGKLNSRVDWKLTNIITGEYYCDYVVELVDATVNACVNNAIGIRNREPDAIARLTEGLILSGIGMLVVGVSRPASGAEHHLSHYWEMKSIIEKRPPHFHGAKVGIATGIIAKFYEKFFSRNPFDIDLAAVKRQKPSMEEWEQHIRQNFGPLAEAVLEIRKPLYLSWEAQKKRIETIQAAWKDIQTLQAIEPTFQRVVDIQQTVGGSIRPEDVGVDQAFLRETLLNAKDARSQYTVMSAADTLGWLEEITDEVVSEYF